VGISGTSIIRGALTLTLLLGTSAAALAQSATPQTIPGLEHFSLPGTRQTPTPTPSPTPSATPRVAPPVVRTVPSATRPAPRATPTPRSSPTQPPRPTPRPTATRPTPVVRAAPTPRPVPTARAIAPPVRATPTPAPRPAVTPSPAPSVAAAPIETPSPIVTTPIPEATPTATSTELPPVETGNDEGGVAGVLAAVGGPGHAFAIAAGIMVALGLLLWFVRRRRANDEYEDSEDDRRGDRHERFDLGLDLAARPDGAPTPPPAASLPIPERVPFAPPPPTAPAAPEPTSLPEAPIVAAPAPEAPPATGRAMIEIALLPRRAGTNLTSAAVEYDAIVRNAGSAPAANIRLDVRLLSAGAQQDALIAGLFAEPIERPITPPFDLLPGTEVRLGGMGLLPRERIVAMTVEGRPLFLPVITVNLVYDWTGGSGQTARSFVIGIERGTGGKMGAFRLDEVRMYGEVGALEYTISVDR
jgi:hypothetical protein